MYFFLDDVMMDEQKDYLFYGVLYDVNNDKVRAIFNDGLVHENMGSSFTLILNEVSSLLKNRVFTDKIGCTARGTGHLFLISSKAQSLFEKLAPNDVEFYDLTVKGSEMKLSDYKIVKVLEKIDCVNLELSELKYNEDADRIISAKSIVLDENKIPNEKQIFLMGKRSGGVILIHENVKKAIEEEGLTGFYFCPLDQAYVLVV